MSFEQRITRAPIAYEPERGHEALSALPALPPATAGVFAGAAGCSPYLAGLMRQEAGWILPALDDPEAALTAELARLRAAGHDDMASVFRQGKRRVALLAALADLGGVWPLESVTAALTDLGDAVVDTAIKRLVAAEIGRGKLPGLAPEDAETGGGMFALAMGKMGAGELNYSSDIDLICLFDEARFEPDDYHDARAAFIRVTRRMTAVISDITAEGYVFRTDLRLRPDAAVTPVCMSMEAAENYYESVGRTWERAAYIKARPAGGDLGAGGRFLDGLRPFVWRRHLDFAAIQDAHDMRLRIREHKGFGGPLHLPGHNMKLGRGGIREIEFFTQTRQLIAGGRDASLRVRTTREGLERLRDAGWVSAGDAARLYQHYRFHREVEHRLQMIGDNQTQDLPTSPEGFDRLAAFMGRDTDALKGELLERLAEVHELTEGFFSPGAAEALPDDGFGAEITARWENYPALRSARAVEIFNRLKPEILTRLREAARPEEALTRFDGFLAGLPAGVQLFSLFEANPQLTRLIVDVCATAPALAQYLSRNAGVFDAVIAGAFFAPWPGPAALTDKLGRAMAAAGDYEAALRAARLWHREWHFRVGVHHLRGLISAAEAGVQYADLAGATIAALWPVVVADFSRRHGPPPGRGACVLGMGSLGAERLNAASDLDLIVIYDAAGAEASDGPRPLAVRPYYARLTQALVTALSAQTGEGRLYEVDMRLRPSGRQGPVATALAGFGDYQRNEAWTWEHLALTRARVIAGEPSLGSEIEALRRAVLAEKAGGAAVLADVAEMRGRIAAAKAPQGLFDAKIGGGRLQDIELLGQTAALRAAVAEHGTEAQIMAGVASGWLSAADAMALLRAYELLWKMQAAARLLTGGALDPEALGEGGLRFLLRETGAARVEDLAADLAAAGEAAEAVISRLLQGEAGQNA